MDKVRKTVKHIRRDFTYDTLDENEAPKNPLDLLHKWLEEAIKAELKEPNAFVLSTVNNAQPDSRVVLLRDAREEGLEFFTNYSSKKGQDLTHNNLVSINFFWVELDRQIRIHAKVDRLASHLSDEYFASRPRASQIGAWASKQSTVLNNRDELLNSIKDYKKKYDNKNEVPRPIYWSGWNLSPSSIEFWLDGDSRIHERLKYIKDEAGNWTKSLLSP